MKTITEDFSDFIYLTIRRHKQHVNQSYIQVKNKCNTDISMM